MKYTLTALVLILMVLLSSCKQQQNLTQTDVQNPSGNVTAQTAEPENYSYEGTIFYYEGHKFDVTSRVKSINSILAVNPVGEKIVIECHVGPQNGVYCIFDTVSKSFETDLTGNHLIWYDDDITTAVYAFWSDIYTYDGTMIKTYELAENEFIYDLAFSENHTELNVTILCDDGTERTDIIDLSAECNGFIRDFSLALPEGLTIGEYNPELEAGGYLLLPYVYFNESDSAPEQWKSSGAISYFRAKGAVEWSDDDIIGVNLYANHTSYKEIGPIEGLFWPAYLLKAEHDLMTAPELLEYEEGGSPDDMDVTSEYWYAVFAKPEEEFGFLVSLSAREYTKEEMIDFVSSIEYFGKVRND